MKFQHLLTASLLVTLSLTMPSMLMAQNPPPKLFNLALATVARVDINRPIKIKIDNQANIELEYDLTANITPAPQTINPGETTTLSSFSLPVYLLINRTSSSSGIRSFGLKYDVVVNDDNVVTVTVTKVDGDAAGYTTFNLNKAGAIYIY